MLTAKESTIDLGTLEFGKVYQFTYDITNSLNKDMAINKLQVSCTSCTEAKFVKSVKGNATETLKVTYTPGSVGNQSKWVDIVYDNDQRLRVQFKAVVNG